ncbi:MAG: hypothetical protein AB8B58_08870 [Roseobacter sp.]
MRQIKVLVLALCSAFLVWPVPATRAMEPLEGWLIAQKACPAFQSKNKRTNPGNIALVPDTAYEMRGTNPPSRDWYQVVIPDAPGSSARWVETTCGDYVRTQAEAQTPAKPVQPAAPRNSAEATDLLLALTWQPAFCERRRHAPECKKLNNGALPVASRYFSLHGLWPQPRSAVYCGVSPKVQRQDKERQWHLLPAPQLDSDTAARLTTAMPGAESFLDRHEWIKHGTCFFGTGQGDEYYDDSLYVLDTINRSRVGEAMAAHLGRYMHAADLRKAFDRSFGAGTGARVEVICTDDQNRRLIQEMRVGLKGQITPTADVGALIRAAPTRRVNCSGGYVDAAGLQ